MDANEPTLPNDEETLEEGLHHFQQEEFEAGEMSEGVEEDDDKSDSFTGMSAADKKKHQVEYAQVLKEIEDQNKIVEELKDQLFQACDNPCLTKCQLREIKKLRSCIENENLKLQCMVQRAIQMQNEIPSRCWNEVPIVTTIEDDVFPSVGNYHALESLGLKSKDTSNSHRKCSKKSNKKKQVCSTNLNELDSDTCKLIREMAKKDKLIKRLSSKLKALNREIDCRSKHSKKQSQYPNEMKDRLEYMQNTVEMFKEDLKCLSTNKGVTEPKANRKRPNELQKLKDSHAQLLCCIGKKDAQIKELSSRIKGYDGSSNSKGADVDHVELKLLRDKVEDMKDEQEEYKCIIKEQSEQLDDYRRKYMDSQQKVEEQKGTLVKIDMNNKRIESQVEAEIKRIKATFKEQLSELSQYPKLLENEQIKHATVCKERDELEGQLRLVCKELKTVKGSISSEKEKPDLSQKLASCEKEVILLQDKIEVLSKEKNIITEEMLKAKLDLDTLRAESVKIITNTKERFEITKISMNSRIDSLEKELAQCRANACLSITDRESVIKEMQSQLSTLSYSFDSAQKQIKTLKNHISFLSNDQCIPIKC